MIYESLGLEGDVTILSLPMHPLVASLHAPKWATAHVDVDAGTVTFGDDVYVLKGTLSHYSVSLGGFEIGELHFIDTLDGKAELYAGPSGVASATEAAERREAVTHVGRAWREALVRLGQLKP